ncbi:hypothetical protein AVEN_146381-1 [Araneus ventricosus]|uniref:Uncharacterized protein n=1 Tax=Araneus ventricosus TaxID=182803 RepID=A0A4Y2DRJ1_ARAVE|nr:hypothetical protein AVEN_146381-1 [Araneus ventricosus]
MGNWQMSYFTSPMLLELWLTTAGTISRTGYLSRESLEERAGDRGNRRQTEETAPDSRAQLLRESSSPPLARCRFPVSQSIYARE